jgi:hypothetical protein
MEIRMPAPKKSLRPKARPKSIYGVEEMSTRSPDGLTIAEREKKEKAEKKMYGGKMKKPVAMRSGGKMPMVKKGGKSVPAFAADGVGKMSYGGKMPKKMNMGGKCRGMGAATRGGNFKMG